MKFKIVGKLANSNPTVKATFWFIICSLIQKAFSFITVPIFTRIMITEQYGIYSSYIAWVSILSVFATLNLESGAYSNAVGKESLRDKIDEITISYASLAFVFTTILLILSGTFINKLSSFFVISPLMVFLMFMEMYAIPTARYWMFRQRFEYKYVSVIIYTIAYSLINFGLGVFFVLSVDYELQATSRVLSIVITELVIGLIFYIGYARKAHKWFSIYKWKDTLRFQLPLIPYYLSMNLLLSSDRIMIQQLIGATEAGIYSVAYSAGQIMTIFKMCLIDALRPWIYKQLDHKEFKNLKKITNQLVALVTALSTLFSLFAPEIIQILAAKQYYAAIYVIPPVALSSLFTFIYQLFAVIETYYAKTTKMMKASVVAAVSNIVLNAIFIPWFGYIAAGYTTLVSYIVLCVMHYRATLIIKEEQKIAENDLFDLRVMITCSMVGIVLCIALSLLYNYRLVRYSMICMIVFAAILEQKKLLGLYRKIRGTEK